jgi:hypothetical protein
MTHPLDHRWYVPTFLIHRRLLLVVLAIDEIVAMGLASLGLFGESFAAMILTAMFVVFVGSPAFLFMLILWRARRAGFTIAAAVFACLVVLTMLLVPATVAAHALERLQFRRSCLMAETVARHINDYRYRRGRCPSDLDELRNAGYDVHVPPFAGFDFYEPDNEMKRYTLTVYEPGFLAPVHVYDSSTGTWSHYD